MCPRRNASLLVGIAKAYIIELLSVASDVAVLAFARYEFSLIAFLIASTSLFSLLAILASNQDIVGFCSSGYIALAGSYF